VLMHADLGQVPLDVHDLPHLLKHNVFSALMFLLALFFMEADIALSFNLLEQVSIK
jgi:hypothetical protein